MYMLLNVYVCVHVYVCVLVQAFHMCILHTMQTQMIDACSHVCKCAQGVCSPTMCAYACICHIAFILYMNILSRALSLSFSFSPSLSLTRSLSLCRSLLCIHAGPVFTWDASIINRDRFKENADVHVWRDADVHVWRESVRVKGRERCT